MSFVGIPTKRVFRVYLHIAGRALTYSCVAEYSEPPIECPVLGKVTKHVFVTIYAEGYDDGTIAFKFQQATIFCPMCFILQKFEQCR